MIKKNNFSKTYEVEFNLMLSVLVNLILVLFFLNFDIVLEFEEYFLNEYPIFSLVVDYIIYLAYLVRYYFFCIINFL